MTGPTGGAAAPSAESDRAELQLIDEFKRGYQEPIDKHLALIRNAQQMLAGASLAGEDRKQLSDARNTLDKLLLQLQNLCRQLSSDLQPLNLDRETMRDYHTLFTGESSEHRIGFVRFLRTYILLKKFILDGSDAWTQIKKAINSLDLRSGREFRDQFLSFSVNAALRSLENFQVFCSRMAILLQLQRDPLASKRLDGVAIYSPDLDYQLSAVFRGDLAAWFESRKAQLAVDHAQLQSQSAAAAPATRKTWAAPDSSTTRNLDWRLDTGGKQSWNSSPHYFLQYSPPDLEEERKAFREVIYIDTHLGADQQFIRSDFILSVSRNDKSAVAVDIEREYTRFLRAFFSLVTDISMLNVGVAPGDRTAFLYHLGPQSFCALVVKFLQEAKTGFMHQRPANRKVIRKFTPIELIKKSIVDWWREEIMPRVAELREDYAVYRKIVSQVKTAHGAMARRAQEEYDKLPADLRARKSKQELFKERMNEWFGATNIVIFRRFLKS